MACKYPGQQCGSDCSKWLGVILLFVPVPDAGNLKNSTLSFSSVEACSFTIGDLTADNCFLILQNIVSSRVGQEQSQSTGHRQRLNQLKPYQVGFKVLEPAVRLLQSALCN